MLNRAVITGRLTRDPEVRYTNNGTPVVSFTLAVDRQFRNQQGDRDADFINCVIWRKSAENFANFTHKGSLVGLDGRIQTRNYENQQGQRVYVTEIVVDNFALLEPRAQNNGNQAGGFGNGQAYSGGSNRNNYNGGNNQQRYNGGQQGGSSYGNNGGFAAGGFGGDQLNNNEPVQINDDSLPFANNAPSQPAQNDPQASNGTADDNSAKKDQDKSDSDDNLTNSEDNLPF
ncbi:single-stranded DNA-binding protein [Limosilactobacillus difficilis]|uniref:single-stranded DNA-binding protein n=1 Tax=Limosilactobacillus difficilis TaxID=2991838 RepID=UPI0024BB18E2|nr:single-stranded DNA-binding protein [Limosilactobacillus difficilis]